ncbi:uncharacterized protein VTP21DRAFT_3302 [Calcarisporiella thermophila]|uniref:uncharacterized protein n=1 Tax=Calcarisporiella thermophila TaxID=911321 RepID=UPI003743FC19
MASQISSLTRLHIRRAHYSTAARLSIGLRREDKSRWERRVALTPQGVKRLIDETGTKVYVQPSTNRVFGNKQYEEAGAIVQEDLSQADVILGIKEVPINNLIPGKTYVYFSHTHKGQHYNMGMLQDILDKRIRLIDYELMTNEEGKRLVMFGQFAGYAGMLDGLHGLGQRMLGLGHGSPFLHVGMAHTYPSLDAAKSAVKDIGGMIQRDGLSTEFSPMTFSFTGTGNVSKGAQEIFSCLPHEYVEARDLPELVSSKHSKNDRVYGVQVKYSDYLVRKDNGKFVSRDDYMKNPHEYTSIFHKTIAPYTSMLITGAYWDPRFPRTLTTQQLRDIQANPQLSRRMLAIADISCDVEGALEFMTHATTICDPFFYVDAVSGKQHKDAEGAGTQIMSVDILPTELPKEASQHFNDCLYPHVKELVNGNFKDKVLRDATIAHEGKLTAPHQNLNSHLDKHREKSSASIPERRKRVLLLGSGFVAKPLVDYLVRAGINVTIASNAIAEARMIAGGRESVDIVNLDANDRSLMSRLVGGADVVVSFIPAPLHPIVAEVCIEQRKHMVTASYISPAMRALDQRAKDAGIVIMNEIGLDPGIDHLSAMKMIDEIKEQGGKITSFVSWCGGLPAPEASDVPLGYKFSWSPRGVLTAALNEARFRMNGRNHVIAGKDLLKSHFSDVPIIPGFAFEGLANRNSLPYAETYGLGDVSQMDTMFRGTLRYRGFSRTMHGIQRLGLMDPQAPQAAVGKMESWTDFLDSVLFGSKAIRGDKQANRIAAIADKLGVSKHNDRVTNLVHTLKWLGMMDPTSCEVLPSPTQAPLDNLSTLLAHKLRYAPSERDMVALHHEFTVLTAQNTKEVHTSSLIAYGTLDTTTAMAKTVGLPAAMATEMVLRGEVAERGVVGPMMKNVYTKILEGLSREGVNIVEKKQPVVDELRKVQRQLANTSAGKDVAASVAN